MAPADAQSGRDLTYSLGDTVVHPRHGVATVRGIASRGLGERRTAFLELVCAANALKILVPMDAVDEVGIRPLPTKAEAAAILTMLAQPSDVSEVWSERSASSTSRVKSGELEQASMVVRDLTRHAQRSGKALSTSENAVLEGCLNSVSLQLSLVLEVSEDDVRALILERVRSAPE